jgi:hypothetical protein
MLARRFTIVCLLTALFGILFAVLVAEASRSSRSRNGGVVVPCSFVDGFACTAARRG